LNYKVNLTTLEISPEDDPAPNIVKDLEIEYEYYNIQFKKTIKEDDILNIPNKEDMI
jgi:hypothetical protein